MLITTPVVNLIQPWYTTGCAFRPYVHHRRLIAARACYRTISNGGPWAWTWTFMETIVETKQASTSGGTCVSTVCAMHACIETIVSCKPMYSAVSFPHATDPGKVGESVCWNDPGFFEVITKSERASATRHTRLAQGCRTCQFIGAVRCLMLDTPPVAYLSSRFLKG